MYYNQKESGKRIAKLRKERGLTQDQLAEKLNISTSNSNRFRAGRRPSGARDPEQHRKPLFSDFDRGCYHSPKREEGRSADPLSATGQSGALPFFGSAAGTAPND